MSRILTDLRSLGFNLRSWASYLGYKIRRITPGPALMRLIAGLAAVGGFAVAVPPAVLASAKVVILMALAAGVSLFPRTRWVTIVAVLTVATWLFSTVGSATTISVVRVGLLAVALYVMHSAAALAAVLPYDAVTTPTVLLRWARRVATSLGASLAIGLTGMVLARVLPETHSIVGPMVGSVVAAGITGLLVWSARRQN